MMKKGIVLLISLFFIAIISLLIFENMTDTDILIQERNADVANTQALVSVNNYKDEIGKLLFKNKENLDDFLNNEIFSTGIFLEMQNVKVKFNLAKYDNKYDINVLINGTPEDKNKLEELFILNGVDFDEFSYFVTNYMSQINKDDRSITTFKQLNKLISEFVKVSNNDKIEEIKDMLGFFNISEKSNFVLCNLDFEITAKKYSSHFIYDLDSSKENEIKVKDFEFIFK